jgi:hypothetical protein
VVLAEDEDESVAIFNVEDADLASGEVLLLVGIVVLLP